MFGERGSEFARIVGEAKERQGEPLDFNSLLLWKLASALAAGDGSNARKRELEDLEHMLHPLQDVEYKEWRRRFGNTAKLLMENGESAYWHRIYQGLWLDALIDLMKRDGLLPMSMI